MFDHRLVALVIYLIAVVAILRFFWAASPCRNRLDQPRDDLAERAEGLLPEDMSDEDWDRWMRGDLVLNHNGMDR